MNINNFKKRKNGEYYKQCKNCNIKSSENKRKIIKKKVDKIDYDTNAFQKCVKCFGILEFIKFKETKKGFTKTCIECLENIKNYKKNKILKNTDNQTCTRCYILKDIEFFSIHKDGTLFKQCNECCEKYSEIRKNRKKIRKDEQMVKITENTLLCNRCLVIKDKSCFILRKTNIYNLHCIECNNNHMKYLEINKCVHGYLNKSMCKNCNGSSYCIHNKIKTYCSLCEGGSLCSHDTRKDRCIICRGSQFCEHDTLRTFCSKCNGGSFCEHKVRRVRCIECNFFGYLKERVSSRINKALKNNKVISSIEYLGCTIQTFKNYLENKFVEGMTWDNYGLVWHIDHIIPVLYNNPTIDDIIKRLHYLNTQPLWAKENISKGNRYIG